MEGCLQRSHQEIRHLTLIMILDASRALEGHGLDRVIRGVSVPHARRSLLLWQVDPEWVGF